MADTPTSTPTSTLTTDDGLTYRKVATRVPDPAETRFYRFVGSEGIMRAVGAHRGSVSPHLEFAFHSDSDPEGWVLSNDLARYLFWDSDEVEAVEESAANELLDGRHLDPAGWALEPGPTEGP